LATVFQVKPSSNCSQTVLLALVCKEFRLNQLNVPSVPQTTAARRSARAVLNHVIPSGKIVTETISTIQRIGFGNIKFARTPVGGARRRRNESHH
jgi:hypothetical protein